MKTNLLLNSSILVAAMAGFIIASLEARAGTKNPATGLKPGDIVYADSGNAIDGGFIMKIDGVTGARSVISSGGFLQNPFDVAVDANGQIVVSDSGRLVCIDPAGNQTVITDNGQGMLGYPCGLVMNSRGAVVCANLQSLIQVDPSSGRVAPISSGDHFVMPMGVALGSKGEMYVLNRGMTNEILRVNPRTGAQTVVSSGQLLKAPQSLAVHADDVYVTDVISSDGNFGPEMGVVIHINVVTGMQNILSVGENLMGPSGITTDAEGQVFVGDPYTVNPDSSDIASGGFDGAIIHIDPASGEQHIVARGELGYVNPRGLAIVPDPHSH